MTLKADIQQHDWPTDSEIFNTPASWSGHWTLDSIDGQEKFIKHCCYCYGLLVGKRTGTKLFRSYYEIGRKTPTPIEPKCTRIQKPLRNGHYATCLECTHNFVTVASSYDNSAKAHELFTKLKESELNQILGKIDHEAAAFGRRYIWCSKCGLYYELPRYREKELLSKGINLNWYV
jgi:hypothetical protein